MTKLCRNCNREFTPRERLESMDRFGYMKETIVESEICDDCTRDLGFDPAFDYES